MIPGLQSVAQRWALTLPKHNQVQTLQWNRIKQAFNSTELNHMYTKQKGKSCLPSTPLN